MSGMSAVQLVLHLLVICVSAFGEVELTFAVIPPPASYIRCCPTALYHGIMKELRTRPGFREDPAQAEVMFWYFDTLRICTWPALRMQPDGPNAGIVCLDAGGDRTDLSLNSSGRSMCTWCCPHAPDAFIETIIGAAEKYGRNHTFAYFKNAQDSHENCAEFNLVREVVEPTGLALRFVGVDLQRSQMATPISLIGNQLEYPLKGVNLLVPLLTQHKKLPVDDDERNACYHRQWLASFSGQQSEDIRKSVFELDGKHPRFFIHRTNKFGAQAPVDYEQLLRDSDFGFVPRGDEHYSFRLTEVLAAGAVPVIIDDDFTPLYGTDSIDEWAVHLPEDNVSSAPEILGAIGRESICHMKRHGGKVFQYASDVQGTVDGLIAGLRRVIEPPPQPTSTITSTTITSRTSTTASTRTSTTSIEAEEPNTTTENDVLNATTILNSTTTDPSVRVMIAMDNELGHTQRRLDVGNKIVIAGAIIFLFMALTCPVWLSFNEPTLEKLLSATQQRE